MRHLSPSRAVLLVPALILLTASGLFAQSTPLPQPAPIPAPILSARKIFIANAGMDAVSLQFLGYIHIPPTEPYDALYAGMQSWGKYQIVADPAAADLVFEIHSREHSPGIAAFQTSVSILDARTHFLLWTVTQPIQLAVRKETWRKNILAANENLIAQLKSLVTPIAPANP